MQCLLCLMGSLAVGGYSSILAEIAPPELLKAKTVYSRDRGNDRKLSDQVRVKVKEWGRWELRDSVKDADLVLVLTVETKKMEKIQLKSLEEPHVT